MFDFYYQQLGKRRKRVHITGSKCVIGSARNNDLVLPGTEVAKRHAVLHEKTDGLYLQDLGSVEGCYVNLQRVVEFGPLGDMDEISVGGVRLFVGTTHTGCNNSQTLHPADLTSINAYESDVAAVLKNDRIDQRASVLNLDLQDCATREGLQTPCRTSLDNTTMPALGARDDSGSDIDNPQADQLLVYWGRVLHEQLLVQLDLRHKDVNGMSDDQLRAESSRIIHMAIQSLGTQIPAQVNVNTLHENVLNESVGLGPLEQFLNDDSISEIMINNSQEIYIEKHGKITSSASCFSSDQAVRSVIEKIITPLGKRIDESTPIVDARLKDGSRVNAVIPPLAIKGPCLTIRKFPKYRLEFSDLLRDKALSAPMVEFLRVCVNSRRNIVVAGGTGTGKTTLLNVMSKFISDVERIVTIEDIAELKLQQPNIVSLESRPANPEGQGEICIRDLVKNALRMRPDRIVVGECRGAEALDMLQAMNTGHDGSMTTLHANSPRDVLSRLEVMVLMAGMDFPISAIREQVSSAVDIIVQVNRFACGARKITRITEVAGMESGIIQCQDIFRFVPSGMLATENALPVTGGQFKPMGVIPAFVESLREAGTPHDLSRLSSLFSPASEHHSGQFS